MIQNQAKKTMHIPKIENYLTKLTKDQSILFTFIVSFSKEIKTKMCQTNFICSVVSFLEM